MLSSDLVEGSDLIVVMEHSQRAEFTTKFPEHVRKCWVVGDLAERDVNDIEDPYMADARESLEIFQALAAAVTRIAARLRTEPMTKQPFEG